MILVGRVEIISISDLSGGGSSSSSRRRRQERLEEACRVETRERETKTVERRRSKDNRDKESRDVLEQGKWRRVWVRKVET